MEHMLNLPKKIYFKTGCAAVALRELSEIYHCSRALLITDPQLYRAGVAAPVVERLRRQGIRVAEYFSIGERVSFAELQNALPKLQEFSPDVIVGVGGNNAMSAAKALLALYADPTLDLVQAAADPTRIRVCAKAKLVLLSTNFASGAQNSPFAVLKDDAGNDCVLKSIHLLPEISVTDADFAAALTPEQIRTGALKILSHAARAYLDPGCTEFTNGLLADAMGLVLGRTTDAMHGDPAALEALHNAAALVGAAYGGVVDTIVPDLPYFPTEQERAMGDSQIRCADLAEQLGYADCRLLFDACEAIRTA